MIIRERRKVYKSEIKKALGEKATADDVLTYLFGDEYGRCKANIVISKWGGCNKTKLHRFNTFWIMATTLLLAPFTYVVYGHVGWDDTTKLGRFFLKITGNLD